MTRYLSELEYKDWARNDLPTVDDAVIIAAIEAAELSLDNACHRRFELAPRDVDDAFDEAEATARLFRPPQASTHLFINDCVLVTQIDENAVELTDSFWQLEPLNGLSPAGEQVPYDSIRCLYRYWYWNGSLATVSVTAVWGWPAIPPQIVEACKVLTKAHLDGRDIRAGIAGFSPDGFAVSEREARVVRQAIADYSLKHSLVG